MFTRAKLTQDEYDKMKAAKEAKYLRDLANLEKRQEKARQAALRVALGVRPRKNRQRMSPEERRVIEKAKAARRKERHTRAKAKRDVLAENKRRRAALDALNRRVRLKKALARAVAEHLVFKRLDRLLTQLVLSSPRSLLTRPTPHR